MDWKDPNIAEKYKAGESMTGPFAQHLIRQAGLDDKTPATGDLVVLDSACGTGIVTLHLYAQLPDHAKARIQHTCGDISPGMIEAVRSRIRESGWAGATAKIIDAQNMDVPSAHFTHILTNFGVVGIPDPRRAIREWRRALRPGGVAGFTVWEGVGWYPAVEAAVRSLGPGGPPFPTWQEFGRAFSGGPDDTWEDRPFFEREVAAAGFEAVRSEMFVNRTTHASAAEFTEVFGGMLKVITEKFWSEAEKEKYGPLLSGAVEKALRELYGEGEIELDWRAWVVTAKVPLEQA
ncbi:hypothetical protein SLS56_007620 [Neofusicoccum ribis]|uniref:Methyltransferase domain-containing protein n=1 Tax=Neofusicoccum ribis TaxID=45134 RepID=A0ABR3SN39_9PEZI